MTFDIKQPAYQDFRNIVAESTERIIAWVGSGASAECDLPVWATLRANLELVAHKKLDSYDEKERDAQRVELNGIENERNPWLAFTRLRKHLGSATFRDVVKDALKISETTPIPNIYKNLWKIGIEGMLSLNLDRLACRAFLDSVPGKTPVEFHGSECGSYSHVINSPQQFIGYLHGKIDNEPSWVLCSDQLKKLMRTSAYKDFVRSCLLSHTVLFLGISIDDIAVGGFLEYLKQSGIITNSHYWITNRCDVVTDHWAEESGVRVIRYHSNNKDHSELNEFFQDLSKFIPMDEKPTPVILSSETPIQKEEIPEPEILIRESSETIRNMLNAKAKVFLDKDEPDYEAYAAYCTKYDAAIHRAWYAKATPPDNIILGRTITKKIHSGAFGTVFRGYNRDENEIAIKLLHGQIRNDEDLLQAFRRGIRSMRILKSHSFKGVARYIDAAEIPAMVVMEWIDGPNLSEVVVSGGYSNWIDILSLSVELAEILEKAHRLPERVLHRDLRPSNVILRNYYNKQERNEVVVTDFDLSWHKGATEDSVVYGSTSAGYLAPEQLEKLPGVSTRHSSVDSFGLGMTLYYVTSRRDPFPAEHRHIEWERSVYDAVNSIPKPLWISLPNRFARLVLRATQDCQAQRWDLGEITAELRRMEETLKNPESVRSAELIAEEIAARNADHEYEWDEDKYSARILLASGISIVLHADESQRNIELWISWDSRGDISINRRNVGKYATNEIDNTISMMRKHGWFNEDKRYGKSSFMLRFSISTGIAIDKIDELARSITDCCSNYGYS